MNTPVTSTPVPEPVAAGVLVSPAWLQARLHDPAVRVDEVDVSRAAYNDWHIDGAVLWNIYADLRDAEYRPVPTLAVQRLLERSGITPHTTVVFYGYGTAMGLWLMKLYGHADAQMLDCSRDTWRGEGRLPARWPPSGPASYPLVDPDARLRPATQRCSTPSAAPAPPCWTCAPRRSTPANGSGRPAAWSRADGLHIPGAVHQPIDGMYDDRGAFLDPASLRKVFSAAGLDRDGELITYCTIGGRASTAWFVLTHLLGRNHVRVYDGSWAEWSKMPGARSKRPERLTGPPPIRNGEHDMPGLIARASTRPRRSASSRPTAASSSWSTSTPAGRPGHLPARLALVPAREADRQDRQLPGRPHWLLHLRPDESRHGRRRGDGIRPRRFRHHGARARRLDRGRRVVRGPRLARLRRLRQARVLTGHHQRGHSDGLLAHDRAGNGPTRSRHSQRHHGHSASSSSPATWRARSSWSRRTSSTQIIWF